MPITSITAPTNRNDDDDDEVSTTTAELINNLMENFCSHFNKLHVKKKTLFLEHHKTSIPILRTVKCFRQLYTIVFLSLFCRLQFSS